jgi:putative ABC transport system permease protein
MIDVIRQDLRYALRGLRRSPGFTLTVMATLGLGIGANVAMFNVTDRLMFRPFPFLRDPSSVQRIYLQTTIRGRTSTQSTMPYTRYLDLRRETSSFSQYAGFSEWRLAVGAGDATRERQVVGVNASFFEFFNAPPTAGRYFTAAEDSLPRGANVAVLGYGYWMTQLGGKNVIGQTLQVGPLLTTIIGVAPEGFVGVSEGEAPAVFVPITTLAYGVNQGNPETFATKYNWDFSAAMVRRKPGVTVGRATSDLTRAYLLSRDKARQQMPTVLPANVAHPVGIAGSLRTAAGPNAGLESRTLLWVSGVAIIVLLIACANVLNLMLARVLSRRREIAVRLALGVSRARLAAQFVVEGLMLAALGCLAGIAVAQAVQIALGQLIALDSPNSAVVTDWRALFIAFGCAAIAGLVVSVGPALLAPRDNVAATLRSGSRQGGGTHQRSSVRATLLVLQGAMSVVLLVGAGLFVRSLWNVRSLDLGWNPEPVLVVTPNYRGMQLDSAAADATRRALLDAARAVPGVASAARVNSQPFATSYRNLFVAGIDSVQRLGRFNYQATTSQYFDVSGTRIVRGRAFTDADRDKAGNVAVISQSMARVLWPNVEPLGQCFRIDSATAPCTRVIGVAEDVVQQNMFDSERLIYYVPDESPIMRPANRVWVRFARGDATAQIETLRRALQAVMPPPGYVTVAPLEDVVDKQRRSWTLGATMFVAFGGLALIVAAVGLYGVISYNVAQRMHEVGIRIALGAQVADVIRLVVGQAVTFAGAGVALGILGALAAARWVEPLLFSESARDPLVYMVVAATIGVVSLVASAAPALRAMRADPNAALRAD